MTEINPVIVAKNGKIIEKKIDFISPVFLIAILIACLYIFSPKQVEQEEFVSFDQEEQPSFIESYIKKVNSSVSDTDAKRIVESSLKWANEFQLSPSLVLAVAQTESTFDKHAISGAGAFGVMQILPKWHLDKVKQARSELGNPELFDTDTNIYLGTWILKDCVKKYKTVDSALLCYNGSVGTKTNYAQKVLANKRVIDKFI